MIDFRRSDPGECLVCGAAHCSCGPGGPIAVPQAPMRDAAAVAQAARAAAPSPAPATTTALGDGSDGKPFSTKTYRGGLKKRRPR